MADGAQLDGRDGSNSESFMAASASGERSIIAAKTRVVVASSVRLVREGLVAGLRDRDGIIVVAAVNLDPEGIARIAAVAPDVVLVDLGHADATAMTRLLKSACSETKLVAFALAAAMFSRLSDLLRQRPARTALPSLTARESEILALAEEGRSNKEIARHLRISSATVKNHVHNILQKLQVGRRGEAAARLRACRADA